MWNLEKRQHERVDIVGLASLGYFLILIGVIFAITPNLVAEITAYFNDFKLHEVAPNIFFPLIDDPPAHTVVYNAVYQVCLALAVFQIFVIGARFVLRESVDRKADSISGLVFWVGAAWIMNLLLAGIVDTWDKWIIFYGWFIILIGVTILVRGFAKLTQQLFRRQQSSIAGP